MRIPGRRNRSILAEGKLDRKRALRLRFRRRLRLQRRQVEELGVQAEQRLENDFFKRLERLALVRRFVTSWVLLVVLLIGCVVAQTRSLSGYYQVLAPAAGGTYTEGILGSFTNANPMYATSLVDSSVSRLVFAGLLNYDHNNRLVGDLAERWSVDALGTTYTVRLKPNLIWHDGEPLTAKDVAFTFTVIQNPDARSPLYDSWHGITVTAIGSRTITFKLPNALAAFPHSLTTGIVPEHILGGVAMSHMRSASFNSTRPIGAGPFKWQAIELTGGLADKRQENIGLKAFDGYNGGKPRLNNFVIRTFRQPALLIESFKDQELTAMIGLTEVPNELKNDGNTRIYNLQLSAAVMTFFRTQDGMLADAQLRRALVLAADTSSIIDSLSYSAVPVRSPLLRGQLAYNSQYVQPGSDPVAAAKILDQGGWQLGTNGVRSRAGAPLSFTLYYLDSPEYTSVASQLARQWRSVGFNVKLQPQEESDFQNVLASAPSPASYTYDALLYGVSIGADPDVYVYWDSSQIDVRSPVRLNFSEYRSGVADAAIEAGRTRLDPALRVIKYQPFLQAWQTDNPALGLYQPRVLYISRGPVYGLSESPINSDAGRFRNVHEWQIRKRWVTPD